MIEPEDMGRFRRHLRTMLAMASEDAAAFAQVVRLAQELDDGLADAAASARQEGFSFQALADELGVGKASAYERFGVTGRPAQVDVAKRRLALAELDPDRVTRLTVAGGAVWGSQATGSWVRLRTCVDDAEAAKLAAYLEGRVAAWRFVRKPKDSPAAALTELTA